MWFNSNTFEDETMFFLIGLVCGLAIYNFTIIDLNFPLVLYKRLLNPEIQLSLEVVSRVTGPFQTQMSLFSNPHTLWSAAPLLAYRPIGGRLPARQLQMNSK
jgi:hypothetical protein